MSFQIPSLHPNFQLSIINFQFSTAIAPILPSRRGCVKAAGAGCSQFFQKSLDIAPGRQYNKRWISTACAALWGSAAERCFLCGCKSAAFTPVFSLFCSRSLPVCGNFADGQPSARNPIFSEGGVFKEIWNGIFGRSSSSPLH